MPAVQFVWQRRERRDLEIALYVMLRHMHVAGWRHLLVAGSLLGPWFLGVEMSPDAREDDAHTWAALMDGRYRVETTIADLLAEPTRFTELYIDGGVAAFLAGYERELERMEELRRRARR